MVLSGSYRFLQNGKQTAYLEKTGKLTLLDEIGQLEMFQNCGDYIKEVAKRKPAGTESDVLVQLSETLGNYVQTDIVVQQKKEKVLNPMPSAATKKAKEKPAKKGATANGKAEVEMKDCICGCGEQTPRNFRPGHDARVHGWAKKVEKGEIKITSLPKSAQAYIKAAH